MNELPGSILLGPTEEAQRLWCAVPALRDRGRRDVVALCELLDLGVRAAEILVIHRLQPVREKFPATIGLQLELPDPDVDVYRDAIAVPKALQFVDIVDLVSDESLECVGPRLHRGWEDRHFSCRRSRRTTQETLGGLCIDRDQQRALLLLAAYRNRIFRYAPPVRLVPGQILDAFDSLEAIVDRLFEESSS